MAKKRKSDAAKLEDLDRGMFSAFSAAANSLSQLYTQATSHHKPSFHAGERHALEKLDRWIAKRQEDGLRVTSEDIIAYLQRKLDYSTEGQSTPSATSQQPRQPSPRIPSPPEANNNEGRSTFSDLQTKNIFSDALSSPVRRSLQQHHLAEGDRHHHPSRTEPSDDDRGTDSPHLNDSLMDMSL